MNERRSYSQLSGKANEEGPVLEMHVIRLPPTHTHLKGDLIWSFMEFYEFYVRFCLVDTRFSGEVFNAYEEL